MAQPKRKMLVYLTEDVGLKPELAEEVAKHMEDEYEVEDIEDLKHLSNDDMDSIVEKTGLKKVSAAKLKDAWEELSNANDKVAALSSEAGGKKRGFLPGYSDAKSSARKGLRLMYLSEEGEGGMRELVVDQEKTSGLFEDMEGDAVLITVFGPARCGKSFLMNLLSGHKDLFEVAHGNLPCTQGVFISEQHEDGATFRRRASTSAHAIESAAAAAAGMAAPSQDVTMNAASYHDNATISFVDVEGLGDKGKAYDVHLIAPLLLVSKVLMYNWKGAPNKHVMLESLLTLGEAAQRVHVGDKTSTTDVDENGKAKPIFGHLVVVLRDWHSTDNVYNLLFGEEAEPARGDDAVKARNRARELVVNAFESITVQCLPYPGITPGDSELENLSLEFVDSYLELQKHLVNLSKTPIPAKLFNGKPLDGPTISHLLPLLASKLNSDEDLLPREVWRLMEEHRLNKLLEEYKDEIKFYVENKINDELPTTESKCEEYIKELNVLGNEKQMGFLNDLSWLEKETADLTKKNYSVFIDEQSKVLSSTNFEKRNLLKNEIDNKLLQYTNELEDKLKKDVRPKLPILDADELSNMLNDISSLLLSTLKEEENNLSEKALNVLDMNMIELFESSSSNLTKSVISDNLGMIGRAESSRLRALQALTSKLQALRRKSEEAPLPESQIKTESNEAMLVLEQEVLEGCAFVVNDFNGRDSFAGEEVANAKEAASTDLTEVVNSWPKHCADHIDKTVNAAIVTLKQGIAAKDESLPAKSGEVENWADGWMKAVNVALDPVSTALGFGPGNEPQNVQASRNGLTERAETEVKAFRAKNAEMIRKVAPPDASHFGPLVGGDTTVQCTVFFPQPNMKFSCPVDSIEIERKPSSKTEALQRAVNKGDFSVQELITELANGKKYTFRCRAHNVNGWGPWSAVETANPYGKPPSPAVLTTPGSVKPADKAVTFSIDPNTGDGGNAIKAYRIKYQPTSHNAGPGLIGECTVNVNKGASGGGGDDQNSVCCDGLTNGVEYSFIFHAENDAGMGPQSTGTVVATPAPPPPKPVITRVTSMDMALQVVIEPDVEYAEASSNNPHAAPPITLYKVSMRRLNTYSYGPPEFKEFEATAVNAFTLRNLNNGMKYQITVEAQNAIGWSAPSLTSIATPNTKWGAFKKVFSFCGGAAASSDAVLNPPSDDEDSQPKKRDSRSASAAVDFENVY
jgi:hypothetical protein